MPDSSSAHPARRRPEPPAFASQTPTPLLLEVAPAMAAVLPEGGLRRGATVVVGGGEGLGATSLVLALLALPTQRGSWCAALGLSALGAAAAEELGVDLTHLALVPAPGRQWATVAAALLDGLDVVVVRPPNLVSPPDARRLSARARNRRAALVVLASGPSSLRPTAAATAAPLGPAVAGSGALVRQVTTAWPGSDLRLAVTTSEWVGPGAGFGHLRERQVEVMVWGPAAAGRTSHHRLWLPAAEGGARAAGVVGSCVVDPAAVVAQQATYLPSSVAEARRRPAAHLPPAVG